MEGTPRCRVRMKSDEESLHRLVGPSIEDGAGDLHSVDPVTGAEGEGEVLHRIALIIVLYCVSEVDRVGGIGDERVLEAHHHFFSIRDDLGLLELGRGDDDLLERILDCDKFVKPQRHLARRNVELLLRRMTADKLGRLIIIRASVGCHPIGAPIYHGYRSAYQEREVEPRRSTSILHHKFIWLACKGR